MSQPEQVAAVPAETQFLFSVRYGLDKEIRRIAEKRLLGARAPTYRVVSELVKSEQISPALGNAMTDVYRVCSPAIHGDSPTEAQVAFVRQVAPQLIAALKAIDAEPSAWTASVAVTVIGACARAVPTRR